jgi:hypothetical protein
VDQEQNAERTNRAETGGRAKKNDRLGSGRNQDEEINQELGDDRLWQRQKPGRRNQPGTRWRAPKFGHSAREQETNPGGMPCPRKRLVEESCRADRGAGEQNQNFSREKQIQRAEENKIKKERFFS